MVYGSNKFFISIINDNNILTVSAGYEENKYRTDDLTKLMIDALPEFALTYNEYEQIKYTNAIKKLRDAAAALYEKEDGERGEPGEILLHLLLRDYLGTTPVASKIFFTDSSNSNVKGFDIIHAKKVSDKFMIYVGESKLTKSFDSALSSLKDDIQKHMTTNFLKKEFIFIGRKVSPNWPGYLQFLDQIDGKRSLDQIKDDMIFVAFASYECAITQKYSENSTNFKSELEADIQKKLEQMTIAFANLEISVHVILLPIFSKKDLRSSFDRRLKNLKDI